MSCTTPANARKRRAARKPSQSAAKLIAALTARIEDLERRLNLAELQLATRPTEEPITFPPPLRPARMPNWVEPQPYEPTPPGRWQLPITCEAKTLAHPDSAQDDHQ